MKRWNRVRLCKRARRRNSRREEHLKLSSSQRQPHSQHKNRHGGELSALLRKHHQQQLRTIQFGVRAWGMDLQAPKVELSLSAAMKEDRRAL
jgi:hypothetical protein